MKTLLTSTIVALAMLSTAAYPSTKRFYDPIYDGYRLDWCKNYSSNCGEPAADMFCQGKGFKEAHAYPIDSNIGETTKVIGTDQLCTDSFCDSFQYIDCKTPKFTMPMYEGYRLDWCKTGWAASSCGSAAANEFCVAHGYGQASGFSQDNNVGVTKIIGDSDELYSNVVGETLCNGPGCDGFNYIYCSN